jgi:hypothetical protein
MNKILKLSAIALLASSTSLMAQSKNFEGFSVGVSGGYAGVEIAASGSNTQAGSTDHSSSGSFGKITESGSIDAGYSFATGPNFLLGVTANYTPGKAKIGTNSFSDNSTVGSQTDSISGSIKNFYTISLEPTYVLSPNSAIYAKIGYSHADVELSSGSANVSITNYSNKVEGWTYGIGSKNMLTNNLYLTIEGSVTDYDNISVTTADVTTASGASATGNPKVVQAKIGLGYRF